MGIFGNSNPYVTTQSPLVSPDQEVAGGAAPPMALQSQAPAPSYDPTGSGWFGGGLKRDKLALLFAGISDSVDPLTMHPTGGGDLARIQHQQQLLQTQKARRDAFNAAFDPTTGKFNGKKFISSLAGGGVTPSEEDVKDYLTPQKPIDIGGAGYALDDATGEYKAVIPKAPKEKPDYNIPGIGRFSGETNQPIVLEPGVTPTQAAAAQSAQGPSAAPAGGATGKFADFQANYLSKVEGGYAPSDGNGKPVNFGINQGANPDIDVAKLTPEKAAQVMHDRYWAPSGADKLPPGLAEVQADTAINMGIPAANRLLQQSGGDPQKYLQLRANRYQSIAASDPNKARLLPTWMARNNALADYVSGAGAAPAANPASAPAPVPGGPMTFTKAAGHPSTAAELASVGLPKGIPAWTGLDGKPVPYPASESGFGQGDDAPLSKDAIDFQASKYLKDGTLPPLVGKYGTQDKRNVLNRATEIAKDLNLSPEDFIAGTIGVKAAASALNKATSLRTQIEGNEQAAIKNFNLALSMAPKGGGQTGAPVLNRFTQYVRKQYAGDPDVAAFENVIGSTADEFAKVMSGSTGGSPLSDSARNEAYSRMSKASTIPQLQAIGAALQKEMANVVESKRNVEEGLRAQIRNGGAAPAAAPATPSAPGGWGKAVVVRP